MITNELPLVSFIIPTLNSGKLLENCLRSILFKTDYPRDRMEIIVVDGGSTDSTIRIAKGYADKLIHNPDGIAEKGKRIGLEESSGEYICFMDSDNEISHSKFIKRAVRGLSACSHEVLGVEAYYPANSQMSAFCAYLTSLLHISDPVSWMMAENPVLRGEYRNVEVFEFPYFSRAYPLGANGFIFRRKDLIKAGALEHFEDCAIALRLAKSGKDCWLRIKGMGVHHYIVNGFWEFLQKRRRQTFHFLSQPSKAESWTTQNPAMSPAMACLACATLIIPILQMLRGFIIDRNWRWVYHPFACLLSVAGIAWGYWTFKMTKRGNEFEAKLQPKRI